MKSLSNNIFVEIHWNYDSKNPNNGQFLYNYLQEQISRKILWIKQQIS